MANLIGQNLGPYRILEQIGQGGMATVFKAYQPSMDRHVALKVLPAHFMQDPTFVERFEREARTIARLEHPHILPVYDYGKTDEGITYIAMRYIEAGMTLADLLRRERPSLDEAARLFTQIADALAYGHEQGILHRDMKPSNVLVDPGGQTFLSDFGLARMLEGTSHLTGSMILGTPAYMAPEQGEGRPADIRSDIYALGIILYEMTTGRPPFEAETPLAVMLKHMTEPLPLPRELNPNLPPAVEQVILKALAKEPDDRYQHVRDMIEALRRAVSAAPTLASPPKPEPAPAEPAPRPKRSPWLWPAVAALALALLAGALVLFGGGKREKAPAAQIAPAQPASETPASASGWTQFSNTRAINALAVQDDLVWAGAEGGLVAWNRRDGSYQKYTTLTGLPYHFVTALLVSEEDDTLWVGTNGGGALHFDGADWTQYGEDEGLTADILSLYETEDGILLAGMNYTAQGIARFDGGNWDTPDWIAPDLPPMPVEFPKPAAFLEGEDGEFITALADEGGLLIFDGNQWQRFTTANGLPSDSINDIAFDADDNLWLTTDQTGGVGLFDGTTFTPVSKLAEATVLTLYTDPDNVLWLGTAYNGLWRFDGETLDHFGQDDGLPEEPIRAITQDDDGVLWLGVEGVGLVRFDGDAFETWAIPGEPPFNRARQILQTGDGRLWFVAQWGGETVAIYNSAANAWDAAGIPDDDTYALALQADGTQWFGTDNGLWRVSPGGARQRFTSRDGLPGDAITALTLDDSGGLWVGTETGLAYHNPADTEVPWRDYSGALAAKYVEMLYVDPEGEVWIGTQGEDNQSAQLLWAADTIYGTWGVGNPFAASTEIIEAAAMDNEGRLWVGTWGDPDLRRLDEKSQDGVWQSFSAEDGAPEGEIIAIAAQPDGPVWFGTWYHGLWNFDPVDGWRQITPADGLPGWAVFALHVDSNGNLWVSTEGGIGRYAAGK